jgi:hypothetical protein
MYGYQDGQSSKNVDSYNATMLVGKNIDAATGEEQP